MKQRLYRDSVGYHSGTSGSLAEFTLPTMTDNIESQVYGFNMQHVSEIDEGDSWSSRTYANYLKYWNGSSWVDVYSDKLIWYGGSASDNRIYVNISEGFNGGDLYRAKMQELNGKRIRFGSTSWTGYNDTNAEGRWYIELWTYYKTPTITEPIFTRDFTNACVNVNTTISYHQGYSVSVNGNTYTNTKSIPEDAFKIGDNTVVISVYNGDMSASKTVTYTFVDYNPIAKSVSFTNTTLDNDTNIEVTATNAQSYELWVNGYKKYTSSVQAFIPPKNSFYLGENSVFVRCYNTTSGRYADTSTVKKTFTTLQPTVTNLTFKNTGSKGNNLTCNPTVLTWQGTNYSYFNIYVNDVIKVRNVNDLTYTMPPYSIPYGQSTIKIEVIKNALEGIVNTEIKKYLNSTITLGSIKPEASNITLSTTNIDREIKVSWDSKNQEWFELLTYPRGIDLGLGTTETSVTIPRGTIPETEEGIKLSVYMAGGDEDIVKNEIISVKWTYDAPVIYNIEPSDLNRNIDEPIKVTFATNEYVDSWTLMTGDNNLFRASGTTGREALLGTGTFNKGANKITVQARYRALYSSDAPLRVVYKSVIFTGYGKPDAPVLSYEDLYSTSAPTISWRSNDEQTGYAYELWSDGKLVTSRVVDGTQTTLTLSELENETDYILQLKIKNKYELYSSISNAYFHTSFNSIIIPEFDLTMRENAVCIAIDGLQDPNFETLCIYRKTQYDIKWVMIADNCNVIDTILDYSYQTETEVSYKLRVYNTTGGYAESTTRRISARLTNYWLTNVENWEDGKQLDFVSTSYAPNRNIVKKVYSGSRAPRVFKGKTLYDVISLDVEMSNKEAFEFIHWLETANDYNIFLYRSWKGEKKYVVAQYNGMNPVNAMVTRVSLTLTEINFIEEKLYKGSGYRKIVYLDGSYFLDGSIDLSGYDDTVISPYVEVVSVE